MTIHILFDSFAKGWSDWIKALEILVPNIWSYKLEGWKKNEKKETKSDSQLPGPTFTYSNEIAVTSELNQQHQYSAPSETNMSNVVWRSYYTKTTNETQDSGYCNIAIYWSTK